MIPSRGLPEPVSIASAPVIKVCTWAQARATLASCELSERAFRTLRASLFAERRARGARVHSADFARIISLAISCRT